MSDEKEHWLDREQVLTLACLAESPRGEAVRRLMVTAFCSLIDGHFEPIDDAGASQLIEIRSLAAEMDAQARRRDDLRRQPHSFLRPARLSGDPAAREAAPEKRRP